MPVKEYLLLDTPERCSPDQLRMHAAERLLFCSPRGQGGSFHIKRGETCLGQQIKRGGELGLRVSF